jgi:hypothetical protein
MGRKIPCPYQPDTRPAEWWFHVLNRGVGRRTLFEMEADYLAFEAVIEETLHPPHAHLRQPCHLIGPF